MTHHPGSTPIRVYAYRALASARAALTARFVARQQTLSQYVSPIIIPSRVAYAERDVRGLLPASVFQLKPSDPARKIAEDWCKFVESKLFPKETADA